MWANWAYGVFIGAKVGLEGRCAAAKFFSCDALGSFLQTEATSGNKKLRAARKLFLTVRLKYGKYGNYQQALASV
jgi:hypothetical protein